MIVCNTYVTHTILIVCNTYHLDRIYRAVFEWKSYVYIVSFIGSFAKEPYNIDRMYRAVFEWKSYVYIVSFRAPLISSWNTYDIPYDQEGIELE